MHSHPFKSDLWHPNFPFIISGCHGHNKGRNTPAEYVKKKDSMYLVCSFIYPVNGFIEHSQVIVDCPAELHLLKYKVVSRLML